MDRLEKDILEVKIISLFLNKRNLIYKTKIKVDYFEYEITKQMYKLILSREVSIYDEELKSIVSSYFDNEEDVRGYISYLSTAYLCETLCILEDVLIERYKKRKLKEIMEIDFKKTSEDIEKKVRLLLEEIEENEETQGELIDNIFNVDDYFNKNSIEYIKTGLIDFDNNFNGLPRQALTIIAGLPSMGKSLLATQIALNISKENNVLFFSEEQSKIETVYKIIANLTNINSRKIINKQYLSEEEKQAILEVKDTLKDYKLTIDDRGGLNCFEMEKAIKKYISKNKKLDVVIVDHLQITNDTENEKNIVVRYGNITRDMKNLAKKYNIAFVCLSQLSRSVNENEDKAPELSNLKNSGDIEANADLVVFIHRESYFLARKIQSMEQGDKREQLEQKLNSLNYMAKLLIKKNRNGILKDIDLFIDLEKQKISNLRG